MTPRIAIDIWPALRHAPGIGRYARELVRALVQLEETPELVLLEVGPGPARLPEAELGLAAARRTHGRVRHRWPRRLSRLCARLGLDAGRLAGGVQLFHRSLPFDPPVRTAAQVTPIFELPQAGSPQEARLAQAVAAGDALVMSEHARKRVIERTGLAPERVHRVHVGAEHWRRELRRPVEPPRRPRILVLGAPVPRRRPIEVLAGFERLRAGGLDAELVLAGAASASTRGFAAHLLASPVAGEVRWIQSPREAELPELVAGSSALLHLADDELTAVTPLEALTLGVGVVASHLATLVEDLGQHALWIDDPRGASGARAIADALSLTLAQSTPAAREERMRHASAFTWERQARETLAVWERVLARRPTP